MEVDLAEEEGRTAGSDADRDTLLARIRGLEVDLAEEEGAAAGVSDATTELQAGAYTRPLSSSA